MKINNLELKIERYLDEILIPFWSDSKKVLTFIKYLTLFNFTLFINYFAVRLATTNAGYPIQDTLFDILPYVDVYNFDYLFSYFVYLVVGLFVLLVPKYLYRILLSTSLLILVRDFFINLTHLGIPEGTHQIKTFFTQGGDLFFSGHVSLPFMVSLIVYENKVLRIFFLSISFVMAAEVLIGRQHYSIDVFSAYLITYAIFRILTENIFPRLHI